MYMGKIGQKSAAFINHKPFHPGSYRNLEKVWIAEQKHQEELRRQGELLDQRQQEGKIEELRRALHVAAAASSSTVGTQWVSALDDGGMPAHIAREISDNKLDWMYHQNTMQKQAEEEDAEKYLLGEKSISEARDGDIRKLKDIQSGVAAGSVLMGLNNGLSNEDFLRKMREDPIFAVRQAEAAHKRALQTNPLLRAKQIQAEEERLEYRKRRKHRHHHHHHRHHDTDSTVDITHDGKHYIYEVQKPQRGDTFSDEGKRDSDDDDRKRRRGHRDGDAGVRGGGKHKEKECREDESRLEGRGRSNDGSSFAFDSHRSKFSRKNHSHSCRCKESLSAPLKKGPQANEEDIQHLKKLRNARDELELGPPSAMVESRRQVLGSPEVEQLHNNAVSGGASLKSASSNGPIVDSGPSVEERPTIESMKLDAQVHEIRKKDRHNRISQMERALEARAEACRKADSPPKFIKSAQLEMLNDEEFRIKRLKAAKIDKSLLDD